MTERTEHHSSVAKGSRLIIPPTSIPPHTVCNNSQGYGSTPVISRAEDTRTTSGRTSIILSALDGIVILDCSTHGVLVISHSGSVTSYFFVIYFGTRFSFLFHGICIYHMSSSQLFSCSLRASLLFCLWVFCFVVRYPFYVCCCACASLMNLVDCVHEQSG